MRGNCCIIDIIYCQGVLNTFLIMCLAFLWTSAFSPRVCDKICSCTFVTVDCSHRGYRKIPDGIPNDTRTLDLAWNTISNISDYSFENLPHLQHLDLSFNEVANIDNNAFVGPRQLLSLTLTQCYISAKHLPKYKGLEYLEDLEVRSCSTPSLSAFTFKFLTRLRRLNLSDNRIKYIDQEAFIGLESLEVLDLSQNELCISELHPTVFQPLRSLVSLLIFTEKCNFTCKPFETSLSYPTLKSLSIGVQDLPFDPIRWGAKTLTFLSLAASCNVNVSGNSFLNVDNITILSILCHYTSGCVSMMSDAFKNLLNLNTLFIHVVYFETIPLILSNALDNNCKSLRKIQIFNRDRGILSKKTLLPFENSKIEELILELGPSARIVGDALRFLPKSLHTINLIYSPVDFYSVITSGFDELPNLSLFKIRTHKFQALTSEPNILDLISKRQLRQTNGMKYFSASKYKHNITRPKNIHKEEDDGEEEKSERTNVTHISLKWKQKYHELPKLDKYQPLSSHINQPPEDYIPIKTLKLDYSNNNFYFKFDRYHVVYLNIDYLDISFNPIYHIPLAFGNIFSQVRIIDLSNTKLFEIADATLQKIKNLTHLDLKNNNLGNIFRKKNFFQNLTNLNYLNLANNSITNIPKSMLKDARNLETLNLSSNQIMNVNVDIYHTKLKTLDLSFNNIQFISNGYTHQIEQLCKRSHLAVNLARNPLRCTCDNLEFFQLTVSCGLILQDAPLTYCEFQNETRTTLDDVNRILDDLERKCKSKIPIIVGSVVASICLFFLLAGALAYRYRWKLRYLYYASKLKWLQNNYDGAAYQRIFDYDAFVSYTDTNHAFVRNEMIQKLEVENNIRLCIHERDFIAGESVVCNISCAIHNSKRTIIVLTEDFLKSDWCMYELNMARVEDLYSDRNVILIIFLLELDLGKLPLDVLHLVRSKTYLKYPKEGTDRETFWIKCVDFLH